MGGGGKSCVQELVVLDAPDCPLTNRELFQNDSAEARGNETEELDLSAALEEAWLEVKGDEGLWGRGGDENNAPLDRFEMPVEMEVDWEEGRGGMAAESVGVGVGVGGVGHEEDVGREGREARPSSCVRER